MCHVEQEKVASESMSNGKGTQINVELETFKNYVVLSYQFREQENTTYARKTVEFRERKLVGLATIMISLGPVGSARTERTER